MEKDLAKKLIKYFKSLGIEVYTNTKARGHQGFFLKNRIDVSKNTREERVVPTLLHEFAHYIHDKLEKDMAKTGGTLDVLFGLDAKMPRGQEAKQKEEYKTPVQLIMNLFGQKKEETEPFEQGMKPCQSHSIFRPFDIPTIEKELIAVTNFVDENSLSHKLLVHKEQVKKKIKHYESQIKEDYPKFMRSKKFKEFDKYIKKSKAKYLLKFDRVKLVSPVFGIFSNKTEVFSVDNIEHDFPDMQRAFCAYIRLKSNMRKQARISKRINTSSKYYSKPTELFSRFVEGLYIDSERTKESAPTASQRFFELLEQGYYFELKHVLEMLQEEKAIATF